MAKVLLVMEDYNERSLLETVLRNVGYDVISIANEYAIAEQLISFGPDVLIAGGNGKRTSSYSVGRKMKDGPPKKTKVILLVPENMPLRNEHLTEIYFDAIIDTPATPQEFFTVLGKMTNRESTLLCEKYNKIKFGAEEQKRLDEENSLFVKISRIQRSDIVQNKSDEQRVADYSKLIVNMNTGERHFPRGSGKKLLPTEDHGLSKEELEQLDREKQEFLAAMYAKSRQES